MLEDIRLRRNCSIGTYFIDVTLPVGMDDHLVAPSGRTLDPKPRSIKDI